MFTQVVGAVFLATIGAVTVAQGSVAPRGSVMALGVVEVFLGASMLVAAVWGY